MNQTKASIRELIGEGKLTEAGNAVKEYAEYCGLPDIVNDITAVSGMAKTHQDNWGKGLISYENYSIKHAQIIQGLTGIVERLPDTPMPPKRRKKPLTEATFKKRIFYAICILKIIVVLRLAYHYSTGGFNDEQFMAAAGLLIPALAAYVSVILADYLKQSQSGVAQPKYLSGPLVTFSYWLFPIYFLALLFFIEMKAMTKLSFSQMNFWIAMTESVLGGYIGQIVATFFKRK